MEKMSKKDLARISKLFGAMGGKARAKRLAPKQRSEIARKAVNARWAKYRASKPTSASGREPVPDQE